MKMALGLRHSCKTDRWEYAGRENGLSQRGRKSQKKRGEGQVRKVLSGFFNQKLLGLLLRRKKTTAENRQGGKGTAVAGRRRLGLEPL